MQALAGIPVKISARRDGANEGLGLPDLLDGFAPFFGGDAVFRERGKWKIGV